MGLFKTKEEKAELSYNKGTDLISQGKYQDALEQLEKSIYNGNNSQDVMVLSSLLRLGIGYPRAENIRKAIDQLSRYPDATVKFGVHEVNSTRVLEECRLKLEWLNLMERHAVEGPNEDLGKQLLECGKKYTFAYADETLVTEEIFNNKKKTGRECGLAPLALGYEVLSETVKWRDSRKAAEYLQKAAICHSENNDENMASRDSRLQDNYSLTAHCWFCGKKVIGNGLHFVAMPTETTEPIKEQAVSDAMSDSQDNRYIEIYVCRTCFSAMNELGKDYLEQGKEYTNGVAAELQAQINSLQSQIASLRFR